MLTTQDFDLLIKALESHEQEMKSGDLVVMMLGAMLVPKEKLDEHQKTEEIRRKQKAREKEPVREACVMLKAKLIQLRNELAAEQITTFTRS